MDAIVMAAGAGTRLRPLTERWPKPILPIDGRPVIATLLRELRAAGCDDVYVVTGHLAEQVDAIVGDGSAFGVRVRIARQPGVLGSADAVRRGLDAGARLPALAVAADTVFGHDDVRRFVDAFTSSEAAGAIAVRREPPPGPRRVAIHVRDGLVTGIADHAEGELSGAPLWGLDRPVADRLCLDREPYELENAYRAAIAVGEAIAAVEIGKTRDLTDPLDLVEENFPYLSGT